MNCQRKKNVYRFVDKKSKRVESANHIEETTNDGYDLKGKREIRFCVWEIAGYEC
jgi:hypothetical protein